MDLTGLNKYVQRPAYPTRVPSEVVASIPPGMRYFTTLDSRHSYWQVPLNEESSKLTTFTTPWGAYRFWQNVIELISAGDEHNRRGDEVLAGVDNVRKVVEDVLIYNVDWATHVQHVRDVLRRCAENGITLHPGRFVLGAPTVSYCGFRLSGRGYTVDDHLVKALTHFPVPVNRTARHPIFLRPGPTISVLLSPPDRVACPHPSTLVTEVQVHLGDPSPRGIRASHPRTGQPSRFGKLHAQPPPAPGNRCRTVERSRNGPVAAATIW